MIGNNYGCAILAGGSGSRMGHINKANLEYGGRTFSEAITDEMASTGLPCYMSVANYEQDVPSGWTVVKDAVTGPGGEYIGPMGGIYSCLMRAREDGLDGLFFVPCDAPFYRSEVSLKLGEYIDLDTDVALWRTANNRLQTTFGWYSTNCIPALKKDVQSSKYKLLRTIEKLRYKAIDASEAGLDERAFENINSPEDYSKTGSRSDARHLLICGKKQVGKTTLIENVIKEAGLPVYGYSTKIFRDNDDGISRVYMYPAGQEPTHKGPDNYIGSTKGKVLDVNTETFERLGTELIKSAKPGGILVMDEIGFMEKGSIGFRKAVTDAFDGDIHVLAAIKDTDKKDEHIDSILAHPGADVIMLTKDNRDSVTAKVKKIVHGWKQEILKAEDAGGKEQRDEQI